MAPGTLSFLVIITVTLILPHQPFIITTASPLAPVSLYPTTNNNTTAPATTPAVPNNIQCFHSSDYVTYRFLAGDCYSAILNFQDDEIDGHSSTIYEFLSSTLTPAYPVFTQRTPRKYVYRSCTMTIVMISDLLRLGVHVPNLPPPSSTGETRRWAKTDLCDYRSIFTAVLNVRDGCLSVVADAGGKGGGKTGLGFVNPVGYDTVGMHDQIGVFLWDTDSAINQLVTGGVVVGDGGGNVTTTTTTGLSGTV